MLPRLAASGMDFTVTKWNNLADALERLAMNCIGNGVLSGLDLSSSSGLNMDISSGVMVSRSCELLPGTSGFPFPSNTTRYVWIDDTNSITTTATVTPPSSNHVCLGRGVSTGTTVAFDTIGRQELTPSISENSASSIVVSSTSQTLTRSQYQNNRIELTGVLTGATNVILPPLQGKEWTVLDSTTGAYQITVKTPSGSGVLLTHSKTCRVGIDTQNNVVRVTSDV